MVSPQDFPYPISFTWKTAICLVRKKSLKKMLNHLVTGARHANSPVLMIC